MECSPTRRSTARAALPALSTGCLPWRALSTGLRSVGLTFDGRPTLALMDTRVETPELSEAIGDALRLARRRRRLSQRGLAAQLGVTKSLIGRLEAGQGLGPVLAVARILTAAGFGLEVVDRDQGVYGIDVAPPDLRDAMARRFPAHAEPRAMRFPHHWWFVRHPGQPRRNWPTWTWRREVSRPRVLRGVAAADAEPPGAVSATASPPAATASSPGATASPPAGTASPPAATRARASSASGPLPGEQADDGERRQ